MNPLLKELKENIKKRNPSCGLIIIDNFYSNAEDVRDYILTQEFSVKGNYPGRRTKSFATTELKEIIQFQKCSSSIIFVNDFDVKLKIKNK